MFKEVPVEQITASAGYRKLLTGATVPPIKSDNFMVISPPNLGICVLPMQPLPAVQNAFSAHLPGWVKVFGVMGRYRQLGTSKELNAGLLEIRRNVNLVQSNAKAKIFWIAFPAMHRHQARRLPASTACQSA